MEGDTHAIDTKLLMLLRDGGTLRMRSAHTGCRNGVDISGLGGIVILTMVTIGAALYLTMMKKGGQALYPIACITLGTLLECIEVRLCAPAPDLVPHGSTVFTNSFPSGHSMMSALVFCVGALFARP